MGSKRWFKYTRDDGVVNAIFADESNTELVNLVADTTGSVSALEPLPKGITPRQVVLSDSTGNITRTCYVLTPARYAALNGATDFQLTAANFSGVSADTVVNITLKTAEKVRRQPKNADTGLNDGDNPN